MKNFEYFFKGRVKAHLSKTKQGKIVQVKEHQRKGEKKSIISDFRPIKIAAITEKESWYNKPAMMGHHWSKPILDKINEIVNNQKFYKTPLQKFILKEHFGPKLLTTLDQDNWQLVNQFSKRELNNLNTILKELGKGTKSLLALDILSRREGQLKSDLTKILEVYTYHTEKEEFLKYYFPSYKSYGMSKEDFLDRMEQMYDITDKSKMNVELIKKVKEII